MKYTLYAIALFLFAQNSYAMDQVAPGKAESPSTIAHPKNAAGSDLIAETTVSFVIKKYADGSVQWVPMPGMQTVVSEKHVKVYNKQALNNLPKHLHDAHKAQTKSKGDGEVVSLPLMSALFGDKKTREVEGRLVGSAIKVVKGVITANPKDVVGGVIGFGKNLVGGIKELSAYDKVKNQKKKKPQRAKPILIPRGALEAWRHPVRKPKPMELPKLEFKLPPRPIFLNKNKDKKK